MINTLLYIDAGSASLLFQLIISGLLTSIIFLKRIILFFKFKKKNNSDEIDDIINKND